MISKPSKMKKKNQIVFINQSSGYLMLDIIDAFHDKYEEKILMAGYVNTENRTVGSDLQIIPLSKLDRTNSIKRIYSWVAAFFKALFLIKFKYRKAHLFIVSNPPIASFIPLFCKNSYDILVFDVFPDALVDFGQLKRESFIIKLWTSINKTVYKKAAHVFTITETMKSRLMRYVDKDHIKVIHLWNDKTSLNYVRKEDNIFIDQNNLKGKFIVQYSGNMGLSYPIEVFITLAEKMKPFSNVHFVLIGSGNKFKSFKTKIEESGLANITLFPWQSMEMLSHTLSGADLAFVIAGESAKVSMPSKTFNLMSLGIPVIAISPEDSELTKLVKNYGFGKTFSIEMIDDIVSYILSVSSSPELQLTLKNKSLAASLDFTKDNALKFTE